MGVYIEDMCSRIAAAGAWVTRMPRASVSPLPLALVVHSWYSALSVLRGVGPHCGVRQVSFRFLLDRRLHRRGAMLQLVLARGGVDTLSPAWKRVTRWLST